MAPSATTDSPSFSFSGNPENDLRPFFVLNKGQGSSRGSGTSTRRKINLLPSPSKIYERLDATAVQDYEEDYLRRLRIEAFDIAWSKIESTIKDVLRKVNRSVFEDVHHWIQESYQVIRSCGLCSFVEVTHPYPVAVDASFKRIFTGLVFTKNMEFVDDLMTFEDLGIYLKSQGCYVANLTSLDFSAKNGIGGCLRSLLRQFLMVTLDAADLSILASWYCGQRDYNCPVVVIIGDIERCCGSILSDFILMLSEWAVKIPIILIIGVTTTLDALLKVLNLDAHQRLHPFKFILKSPAERMDVIVKSVLLNPCSWFTLDHKVALFLRKYFLNLDGSFTSFIRGLKVACVQHFSTQPLSFLLKDFAVGEDFQHIFGGKNGFPQDTVLKYASKLPSCRRMNELTGENFPHGLTELKESWKSWISAFWCKHEAVKTKKIRLLDFYCEELVPSRFVMNSGTCNGEQRPGGYPNFSNSISHSQADKHRVRDYVWPVECLPLHEIICFKNVDKLQSALLGDPRRTIQVDLLDFNKVIGGSCYNGGDNMSSLHDTSLLYCLADDHEDAINLQDWYRSFKATFIPTTKKGKNRPKHSPSPKKRKYDDDSQSEAAIQARFCRAVTELQISGLIRMPGKRRPDYVLRVASKQLYMRK
ncbi:hypothetical protein Nepgr_021529 [Nepenthes gracilis]|uniref:Origin of replication complex subunit 3 n=1 Tax=Nepenthes gracilis TaxID=150966 RepID=A0AAD3SYA0_NEPGR|nr:hypothetical protein Nepgr_021529 [Nepenthes gracilis]